MPSKGSAHKTPVSKEGIACDVDVLEGIACDVDVLECIACDVDVLEGIEFNVDVLPTQGGGWVQSHSLILCIM